MKDRIILPGHTCAGGAGVDDGRRSLRDDELRTVHGRGMKTP